MAVMDLFSLRGRSALVTGGNGGIGLEIARAFGEAGAAVTITGRDADRLDRAAEDLRGCGIDVVAAVGDVTIDDQARRTVEAATDAFGPVDILVNNVGHGTDIPTEAMTMETWQAMLELNLTSVFRMCRLVAPSMLSRGKGNIVNLGSISGDIINRPQWHAPYHAAKAGVHHLTRALAAEWAGRGIRVNAVAPGFVDSRNDPPTDPDFRRWWIEEVPARRMARPEEIAPAALYLASDASSFANGTVLTIDGGYTLW